MQHGFSGVQWQPITGNALAGLAAGFSPPQPVIEAAQHVSANSTSKRGRQRNQFRSVFIGETSV